MFRSLSQSRIALAAILFAVLAAAASAQDSDAAHRGRKYKAPPPTAHFEITVVRATTGKPIENAAVIFHPLAGGKDDGNMELKTNEEGKATLDLLEIGSDVRVQIIAPGFQTYGEDFKIEKDQIAVEVKMKRPGKQYSLYPDPAEKKAEDKSGDAPKAADPKDGDAAKPDSPADAGKPAAKPADPAPQPK